MQHNKRYIYHTHKKGIFKLWALPGMYNRCNFRLNTSNWNTTHSPTMVTSSAASKCSNSQPLMNPQPLKCCSKHPNAPTQSRSATNHHKSTKRGKKSKKKLRQRKSKTKNRERKKHTSGCWIWSCLLISLMSQQLGCPLVN